MRAVLRIWQLDPVAEGGVCDYTEATKRRRPSCCPSEIRSPQRISPGELQCHPARRTNLEHSRRRKKVISRTSTMCWTATLKTHYHGQGGWSPSTGSRDSGSPPPSRLAEEFHCREIAASHPPPPGTSAGRYAVQRKRKHQHERFQRRAMRLLRAPRPNVVHNGIGVASPGLCAEVRYPDVDH